MNHAKAFGRIAFCAPGSDLPGIEEKVKEAKHTILTPYLSLDTPGKATVQVVILADPVSVINIYCSLQFCGFQLCDIQIL